MAFRRRYGRYPEQIYADHIYRTRSNHAFYQLQKIHLSGPRLRRAKMTLSWWLPRNRSLSMTSGK